MKKRESPRKKFRNAHITEKTLGNLPPWLWPKDVIRKKVLAETFQDTLDNEDDEFILYETLIDNLEND